MRQRRVGGLQCHVGAAAHRNADGGSFHCRGIVYSVPDHRQRGVAVQLGYRADFIRRQQSGLKLQPQLACNRRRRARIIAGQDHALYSQPVQCVDGLFRIVTQGVAQRQHAHRHTVLHHGNDRLPGLLQRLNLWSRARVRRGDQHFFAFDHSFNP